MYGGSQERKRRAGTENVAGIVGFAAAMDRLKSDQTAKKKHILLLRQSLLDSLSEQLSPQDFIVNGHPHLTLPHILNISFPGIQTETMLMNLDLAGIAAASGSACSSGSLEVSHVLKAMHLSDEITSSAIQLWFDKYIS
jgi:cysteine desulfurase